MKRPFVLYVLLAGAALITAQAQAQPPQLGRLFLSPEQRAQLDAQRYGPPAPAAAVAAPPSRPRPRLPAPPGE